MAASGAGSTSDSYDRIVETTRSQFSEEALNSIPARDFATASVQTYLREVLDRVFAKELSPFFQQLTLASIPPYITEAYRRLEGLEAPREALRSCEEKLTIYIHRSLRRKFEFEQARLQSLQSPEESYMRYFDAYRRRIDTFYLENSVAAAITFSRALPYLESVYKTLEREIFIGNRSPAERTKAREMLEIPRRELENMGEITSLEKYVAQSIHRELERRIELLTR